MTENLLIYQAIYITITNITIIIIWIIPFVIIEVKNPTSEPIPVRIACFTLLLLTINSASTAPKKGPSSMPAIGMTNGPINKPIVLPHIPAFEPPNFFTPKAFANVSAPNNNATNKI